MSEIIMKFASDFRVTKSFKIKKSGCMGSYEIMSSHGPLDDMVLPLLKSGASQMSIY